jgi:ribonucleoside-diphosphate reductase alpha chain
MAELRPGELVAGRFQASHGEGGAALPALGELRTNAKLVKTPERMSPQLAQFLGMLTADGHTVLESGAIGLTSGDTEAMAEFTTLSQELLGMEPRHAVETRNANVHYLTLNSRALCQWVRGLIGEGAYTKRVPLEILAASADEKLAFLRGVSLDGYHHPKYGLYVSAGMSERLAYGVAQICRSCCLLLVRMHRGMVAATGNISYKALISDESQEVVSCIEAHKNGPAHHATYQALVHQEVVEDTRLPASHPFYGALRSIKQREPQNCDNRTAMRLGWNDSTPVCRVTAVEDAGVIPLYDIEVEDAREYTVSGIVSHNTINLPNSATRDDVRQAYMLACDLACLGITIFRDGSQGEQVLNVGVNVGVKEEKKAEEATETRAAPAINHRYTSGIKGRPEVVHGYTRQARAPEGKVNITLTSDEDGLLEIVVNVGKAGSDIAALAEAVGRLASLNLRLDSPLSQNERAREIARNSSPLGVAPRSASAWSACARCRTRSRAQLIATSPVSLATRAVSVKRRRVLAETARQG